MEQQEIKAKIFDVVVQMEQLIAEKQRLLKLLQESQSSNKKEKKK